MIDKKRIETQFYFPAKTCLPITNLIDSCTFKYKRCGARAGIGRVESQLQRLIRNLSENRAEVPFPSTAQGNCSAASGRRAKHLHGGFKSWRCWTRLKIHQYPFPNPGHAKFFFYLVNQKQYNIDSISSGSLNLSKHHLWLLSWPPRKT